MNPQGGAVRLEQYVSQFRADADRLAAVLDAGPLDAPVEACPGWDLFDLARHLGAVHRWALSAVVNAESPGPRTDPDVARDGVVEWFRDGAAELAAVLEVADPLAPTWHPFGGDRVAGVWQRRQAHEIAIHRWDAEHAVGATTPIPAELASDGIDEYFEIFVPMLVRRAGLVIPDGSLHVHCTDVAGEWLLWGDDNQLQMRREHAKGDAAVRGSAEAILLQMWSRRSPSDGQIDIIGGADVAAAWLSLPAT